MASDKRIPAVRFDGFIEEWEEKKLGEIGEIIGGGTPSTSNIGFWNGTIDWYSPTEIGYDVYANGSLRKITKLGLENSSAIILPANRTILFTSRAGIGDMAILLRPGATNQGFQSIVLNEEKGDVYFIYSMGFLIKKFALKYATGSTFLEISRKNLAKMPIKIPVLSEQNQIGNYFKDLDDYIRLQERRLDKLMNLKKAMLEKMFPKENTDIPEVRFKGFNDIWNGKKLDEVASIVGGGTPSTSNRDFWNGNIDWYSPTEIGDNVYADGSKKKITQLGLEKSSAVILPANRTILFTSRAGIGDMAILRISGATNQGFQSLVLKDGYDSYFIYSMGFLIKRFAIKYSSGSTFLEISGKALGRIQIKAPKLEEQQKIGEYFRNLDQLIDQSQQKIGQLKNLKKAMLQKMFI